MSIFREFRHGLRNLRGHPLITGAAIVTLALGIGANTTVFSFVRAVLIDPFAYRDPENTVLLWGENAAQGKARQRVSAADFRDWQDRNRSFDRMAACVRFEATLSGLERPERIVAARVSPEFFGFFASAPALGRSFLPEEYRPGADRSAILSNNFWRSHFGGDPSAPGRTVYVDGRPYTVIGVMPADFWFPSRIAAMWLPFTPPAQGEDRTARAGIALAHLRPGTTLRQANEDLAGISRELARLYPAADAGWSVRAYAPLDAVLGPNDRVLLVLLFGVVGALLLVACSNVANLLLAQAAARRREMAIRTAVGATRWRLMRQSLAESFLLAAMAGGLGLLAGMWAKDLLIAIYPSDILITSRPASPALLGFCLAVSTLAAVVFGAAPAWDSCSRSPLAGLKEERTSGARAHRLAGAFVISQIALSTILLIVTGLFLQTMRHLRHIDLGFRPGDLAIVKLQPSTLRRPGDDQLRTFYRAAIERVARLPRVENVSATSALPLFSEGAPVHVAFPGRENSPAAQLTAMAVVVAPGYFQTAGIPLRRGRDIGLQDVPDGMPVAVVNQAFAARFFKDEDPIGKRVYVRGAGRTIVGVSADVRPPTLQEAPAAQVYLPFAQAPQREMTLLVKAGCEPSALLPAIRAAIAAVDKDEPADANTMVRMLEDTIRSGAVIVKMLAVFAGLALTMASVGLFSVVAYTVNERTRELGIRIALGASPKTLLGHVLGRGVRLAAVGLGIGLLSAAALVRLLRSLLIEVSPWDMQTFGGVAALLLAVTALASFLPALRAMRTDPITALRQD